MRALIAALVDAEQAARQAAAESESALERARLLKLADVLRAEARSHLRRVA